MRVLSSYVTDSQWSRINERIYRYIFQGNRAEEKGPLALLLFVVVPQTGCMIPFVENLLVSASERNRYKNV